MLTQVPVVIETAEKVEAPEATAIFADRFYREPEAAETQTPPTVQDLLHQVIKRTDELVTNARRPRPFELNSWEEISRFADDAARTEMVPRDYRGKPDAIRIAVIWGKEIGLHPMQALRSIAVIGGRPALWGDAVIGLIYASGKMEYLKEWAVGEGDDLTYWFETKRQGNPLPIARSFGVRDAKKAGLWGKQGPWSSYPQRMLAMRARGWGARDAYPDVLGGLLIDAEAMDTPSHVSVPMVSQETVVAATQAGAPWEMTAEMRDDIVERCNRYEVDLPTFVGWVFEDKEEHDLMSMNRYRYERAVAGLDRKAQVAQEQGEAKNETVEC